MEWPSPCALRRSDQHTNHEQLEKCYEDWSPGIIRGFFVLRKSSLRVIRVVLTLRRLLPIYPNKPTFAECVGITSGTHHSAASGITSICSWRMTPDSGSNSPTQGERCSTALVWV